jgi:hypothetical protein
MTHRTAIKMLCLKCLTSIQLRKEYWDKVCCNSLLNVTWGGGMLIPGRGKRYVPLRNVPAGSWAHPTSNTAGIGDCFLWVKEAGAWNITVCMPWRLEFKWVSAHVTLSRIVSCFHAGSLLGLFFDPEEGGDMFLRNVVWLLTDYTALYHRIYNSSYKTDHQVWQ